MKLSYFIYAIILLVFLLGCKAKMDMEIEKSNPLEGTTWEMVSAKYTWGDSTLICPMSEFHQGLEIWGKTHVVGVWQDTSGLDSAFVGHMYTIKDDTVIFKIKFHYISKFVGHSFKLKYEFKEDQLIFSGIFPEKKWKLGTNDMELYEVWKKID